MSKIIASIDGMTATHSVCDYAAWFSQKLNLPLELLNVIEKQKNYHEKDFSSLMGIDAKKTLLDEMIRLDEAKNKIEFEHSSILLKEAAEYLKNHKNSSANINQTRGDLLDVITHLENVSLLCMGKKGANSADNERSIGSQITNIARAIHIPLFISSNPFKAPKSFIIAFDGSKTSQKCVDLIANSDLLKGLGCHLVYVGKADKNVTAALSNAETLLLDKGFNPTIHQITDSGDSVEAAILNLQDNLDIDMIAMGAYGHSAIRDFFIGSTTTTILRLSNKPVLLIR